MNPQKEKLLNDTYQSFIDQCLGRIKPDALIEILSEDAPGFLAMPASIPEMSMEGKEIIIKDQGTDGKTITAAYHALLIDGIWTLQPLWLISEIKANKGDSLATKKRDSVMHLFPGAL